MDFKLVVGHLNVHPSVIEKAKLVAIKNQTISKNRIQSMSDIIQKSSPEEFQRLIIKAIKISFDFDEAQECVDNMLRFSQVHKRGITNGN